MQKTFGDVVDENVDFVQMIFDGEHIVSIDMRCKSSSIMKKIFRNVKYDTSIWYPGPRLLKLFIEGVE